MGKHGVPEQILLYLIKIRRYEPWKKVERRDAKI
jgi:hypothetical protein